MLSDRPPCKDLPTGIGPENLGVQDTDSESNTQRNTPGSKGQTRARACARSCGEACAGAPGGITVLFLARTLLDANGWWHFFKNKRAGPSSGHLI